ncbi:SWIM zinc finger family protein [Gloeocapsopsis crepidinum LEGE 06123]|uniref:SWIM zinc finger family protein n=1 Tax=Gloeocapsopsis crepidinum LEGE 06123 TaxID=588587 RepID=A0ABR9UZ00_9CHRO|nr:SWIM zinc finger family protein [Gloeocapsopsis crepidinum]MBE9193220.1 SWIM zinc finger family protein [Gloeocapsopsis crepidinum LEGE 06123]
MTNFSFQSSREWWSQRWLDLLDSYRFKKRLERARNYSRQGNVLSIQFEGAKVSARVQGTEVEPYQVSLFLEPFTDEQWQYVIETMSQRAIFAAKLLAGEMPPNIEEVFTLNGLSLFPFTLSEVRSKCSCPDKANPCKHIAAVYYQLGDRFSEDPFVLFQLRGRTKNQIIDALRELRSAHQVVNPEPLSLQSAPQTSLNANGTSFWHYREPLESNLVVIAPSTSSDVLEILGAIPLSNDLAENADNSSEVVMHYLNVVYQQVAQQAFLVAMNTEAS